MYYGIFADTHSATNTLQPAVRNGRSQSKLLLLYIMLVSHCGEYMANGLTNAVRHEFVMIANDRQTFVAVRKHSRSFCGVSNVMLVTPVANVWRMGLRKQFAINSQ